MLREGRLFGGSGDAPLATAFEARRVATGGVLVNRCSKRRCVLHFEVCRCVCRCLRVRGCAMEDEERNGRGAGATRPLLESE